MLVISTVHLETFRFGTGWVATRISFGIRLWNASGIELSDVVYSQYFQNEKFLWCNVVRSGDFADQKKISRSSKKFGYFNTTTQKMCESPIHLKPTIVYLTGFFSKMQKTLILNVSCRFISLVIRGLCVQICLFPPWKTPCWQNLASSDQVILFKKLGLSWILKMISSPNSLLSSKSLGSNMGIVVNLKRWMWLYDKIHWMDICNDELHRGCASKYGKTFVRLSS